MKTFYLNKSDVRLMGVCAGIGDYFKVDPTFVRIGAVVLTLLGAFPWTLVAYGVIALVARVKAVSDGHALDTERMSLAELRSSLRSADHRMAEVDAYVAASDSRLARKIDELR